MPSNEILTERRGQALIITLNAPERANRLTLDMANQLFTTLKSVTTDKSVRAVLLRGAGDTFMDGIDMSIYYKEISAGLEQASQIILPYHSAIREIQAMDKPVLACVAGRAAGPGLSLILASDLVIAGKNARLCADFVAHALTPDGGCSYFLARKAGLGRAAEIMLLGEEFEAARAESLGIVNRIVEESALESEAFSWLDKLAEGPTKAYGAVKKLALRAFEQDMNQQLGLETTFFGHASRSFDFRDAVKAVKEGKQPKFSGT